MFGKAIDRIIKNPVSTLAGIGISVLQIVATTGMFDWDTIQMNLGPAILGMLFKDK